MLKEISQFSQNLDYFVDRYGWKKFLILLTLINYLGFCITGFILNISGLITFAYSIIVPIFAMIFHFVFAYMLTKKAMEMFNK